MIYFDNAATTPVDPEVQAVIMNALREEWGNPSSLHRKGFAAEKRIKAARSEMAEGLGVDPSTLIFTSGASEGLNAVLRSAAMKARRKSRSHDLAGANLVLSAVEHAAVYETARSLEQEGMTLHVVPVDAFGRVSAEDVLDAVDDQTVLVALMHVNNELGTIMPVEEVGAALRERHPEVMYLVDGTQALGKMEVHPEQIGCDYYVGSGHKMHAPKGIGLLYRREGAPFYPLITGGPQENGQRAGTENVAYILGFAKAFKQMSSRRQKKTWNPEIVSLSEAARQRALRMEGVRLNSPEQGVSPYILNFALTGVRAEVILHFMEQKEMYLSSGSACSLGQPSRVLQAIGLPEAYREGALRLSFGSENRLEDVNPFFDALEEAVAQIRLLTGGRA